MNILDVIKDNGITFNRFPDEVLKMPYDIEEVTIQPNDTVTVDVVNLKLKHIYDNFLYLYSKAKIASNIIPVSSTAILGVSTGAVDLAWCYGLSSSQFESAALQEYYPINNTKVLFAAANKELPQYTLITSDGKSVLMFFNYNDDTPVTTFTYMFSAFNPGLYNEIFFIDVVAIKEGPDNSFLILDKGHNTLYQYDARGLYTSDNMFSNKLRLRNLLGEFGPTSEKLSFNAPTDVVTYNNEVYVLDTGNSCVKRYDNNLNWLNTYLLNKDFLNTGPLKLQVDNNGTFYCLLSGNIINLYTNNFENKQEIIIDYLNNTEQAIDIVFSKTDYDIYYLVTTENVYKGLTNDLNNTIGKYLLYLQKYNNTQNISAFATMPSGLNDKNFLASKNSVKNAGIVGIFLDNKNLYDNLTEPDFDIYSLDEILIKPEEYVQSWVINKAISKLIANHLRFTDQIIGKFQFKYDSRGNSVFCFTRYLTVEEKNQLSEQTLNILQ